MAQDLLDQLNRNLPTSPGVLGREKYFNSAVLVPLVLQEGDYHFLFQKRAAGIRQGGEICFPGGRHEPSVDCDYQCTALRETTEELGIPRESIQLIGQLDTLVAPLGAAIDIFVAKLDPAAADEVLFDPGEVESVFTLPVSYFRDNPPEKYAARLEIQPSYMDADGEEVTLLPARELNLPEIYHTPWGGRHYRILHYKTDFGPVWGMTAEIVYDLIQRTETPERPFNYTT